MPHTPRAILILFCIVLITPLMVLWFDLDPFMRHNENRKLADRPKLSWSWSAIEKLPREYQLYFNDNFGFRPLLVKGNFFFRYELLGVSTSKNVVVGDEGWLYYAGEGDLNDCRGITKFTDDQLRRSIHALQLKKAWLAQRGIHYLLVIPPNKSTIYPEYLPVGYKRVRQESGLDDFVNFIRKNSNLDVLDLRASLLEKKQERSLYFRTDTHWNDYGAFIAYQEIIKSLTSWFPAMVPFRVDDFSISLKDHSGGDLTNMIGGQEFLSDENYIFTPKKPFTAIKSEKNERMTDPFTMTKEGEGLPRVVIFRDSFFAALIPFFTEHFSVSRYIWSRWNSQTPMEEIVAKYQPQVVIEEVLERYIKTDADIFARKIPSYLTVAPPSVNTQVSSF